MCSGIFSKLCCNMGASTSAEETATELCAGPGEQRMHSQPPPGGGRLSEDVYRKLRAVEDGSSTLTAAGLQGLSARILHANDVRDPTTGEIYVQQMVEIIKKPGQSLGLYLREGNGIDRVVGVFASRFGEGSELERYGDVIRPGDEILAVNNVEVSKMAIDDVVLILSIPRRLVLRLQFNKNRREMSTNSRPPTERPVVVFHRLEERKDDGGNILAQPTNTANTWLGKKARQETMSRHATIQRNPGPSTSQQPRAYPTAQTRSLVNGYGPEILEASMDTVARTARVPPPKIFSAGSSQVRRTESFNSAPPSTFTMPRSTTTAGPSDPLLSRSLCSPVLPRPLRDHKSNSLPRRRAISGPRNVKWRTDALLSDVYDDEGTFSAPEHGGSPAMGPRSQQPYARPYSGDSGRTINDIFSAAEYRYWAGPGGTPTRPSRWSHTYGENRGPRSSSLPGRTLMAQSLVGSPIPPRHVAPQTQVLDRYHVSPLMNRRTPLRPAGPGIDVDRLAINSLTGILFVQILEGKGLRLGERERERAEEMYCVLEVDEQHRARTGVTRDAHREGRYRWRETFHIDVYQAKLLQFYIYSWHPEFRHKLHFRGALRLLDKFIVDQLNGDHMFSLNLEPRGQVHVRVGFHDMSSVFRRPCAPKEGVFAVPLGRLIARERRETPIALTRLIQEIERRGVDYNGIYVLCGAVEKKQLLREELEVNPLGAELSPDAMPDTNVLACLVKDFLRELPEPLIPPQIHAMLRDVAAVAPPNDMTSGRDLVFRVLDCLPQNARTCLLMILDHLVVVLQSAPHNGLSVAKLAVIFAPLLMCCGAPPQRDGLRSLDVTQAATTLQLLLEHWLSRVSEKFSDPTTVLLQATEPAARTPMTIHRRPPPLGRFRNLSVE